MATNSIFRTSKPFSRMGKTKSQKKTNEHTVTHMMWKKCSQEIPSNSGLERSVLFNHPYYVNSNNKVYIIFFNFYRDGSSKKKSQKKKV